MSISTVRPGASNPQIPTYLKDNLPTLEDFSKKLDGISQEIRTVESKLQNCGICLKFIYPTLSLGGYTKFRGEPNEQHFNRVWFLGWLEETGKFRLTYGEAWQACDVIDSDTGKTRARTGVDDYTVYNTKPLIETKAQVRLESAHHIEGFVKALTEHVAAMTWREDEIPF